MAATKGKQSTLSDVNSPLFNSLKHPHLCPSFILSPYFYTSKGRRGNKWKRDATTTTTFAPTETNNCFNVRLYSRRNFKFLCSYLHSYWFLLGRHTPMFSYFFGRVALTGRIKGPTRNEAEGSSDGRSVTQPFPHKRVKTGQAGMVIFGGGEKRSLGRSQLAVISQRCAPEGRAAWDGRVNYGKGTNNYDRLWEGVCGNLVGLQLRLREIS